MDPCVRQTLAADSADEAFAESICRGARRDVFRMFRPIAF